MQGQRMEKFNAQQLRQVIQTAAQLQVITQGYRPRLTAFRWNYNPELCLKLVREKAQTLANQTAYAKVRWFEQQLAALELPRSLPKGICHTDFDPSNLLFDGDKLVALLDFDDANYTYLLFDLASLIDGYGWEFGKDFDIGVGRDIAQTYLVTRTLSEIEKHHIFDVHKLSILFDGIWFFWRGTADDYYEKHKIAYLDSIGRETYYERLFA
jgi:Ser/Thr protein kinase RdoA (MazF antagonist)